MQKGMPSSSLRESEIASSVWESVTAYSERVSEIASMGRGLETTSELA
jgi:hypothetical protein